MLFQEYFVKLLISAVMGSLIGLEREYHGRPAGLRTHMLVCIGAAMITVSGLIVGEHFCSGAVNRGSEVSRVIAGVVTGIGFLGAGAIIRTSDFVRGLTTAACIWFVAAIGVVIGLGEYVLALFGTGIALLILVILPFVEERLANLKYRDVIVVGENRDADKLVQNCSGILQKNGIRIHDMDIQIDGESRSVRILFHLRMRNLEDKIELLSQLSKVEGVTNVQWQRTPARI